MSKPMDGQLFISYYRSGFCLCTAGKSYESALCDYCRDRLQHSQPALLHVIQNGTGDPLLQAMGEFRDLVRQAG